MNRKTKRRVYVKLVILLLCLIILIRMFTLVLSKYESETNSNTNVDIAFYLLNEDYKTMQLNLASIFPQNDAYVYTFSIGNTDREKQAEVNLEYELSIRTTTNLPLTFELYMNQEYTDSNAVNIVKTNEIKQDDDGTFFRYITVEKEILNYDTPKTNTYQLVIHFPENYNTEEYQDIIEMLEITVNSKQIIK